VQLILELWSNETFVIQFSNKSVIAIIFKSALFSLLNHASQEFEFGFRFFKHSKGGPNDFAGRAVTAALELRAINASKWSPRTMLVYLAIKLPQVAIFVFDGALRNKARQSQWNEFQERK
jgi:hypothetical protein